MVRVSFLFEINRLLSYESTKSLNDIGSICKTLEGIVHIMLIYCRNCGKPYYINQSIIYYIFTIANVKVQKNGYTFLFLINWWYTYKQRMLLLSPLENQVELELTRSSFILNFSSSLELFGSSSVVPKTAYIQNT